MWNSLFFIALLLSFRGTNAAEDSHLAQANALNPPLQELEGFLDSRSRHCPGCAPQKAECAAIRKYPYPSGHKFAFEGGLGASICDIHWKTSNGRSRMNLCGSNQDRYSATYVTPTKSDMVKNGLVPLSEMPLSEMTPNQNGLKRVLKETYAKAKAIQKVVASRCCGHDEQCLNAMNDVKIEFCRPPNDPKEPDHCTNGPYYTFHRDEVSKIWSTIFKRYKYGILPPLRGESAKDAEKVRKVLDSFYPSIGTQVKMEIESLPQLFADFPLSGKVVLPGYLQSDGEIVKSRTVFHEFFHACDFIKAQQLALRPDADSGLALGAVRTLAKSFPANDPKDRCALSPELARYYDRLWQDTTPDAKQLASCLESMSRTSDSPVSPTRCDNACKAHFVTESFAMAGELLLLDPMSDKTDYSIACYMNQDGWHPLWAWVLECVAQHSSKFRSDYKRFYSCGP